MPLAGYKRFGMVESRFTRFTVTFACRIAGINRDRFNEAVHAGHYPCAPTTTKGSRRLFDEDDLIALYTYACLLEEDFPARTAGDLACRILNQVRSFPEEILFNFVRCDDGGEESIPGKNAEIKIVSGKNSSRPNGSKSPVVSYRIFDIGNIRKIVKEKVREESSVLGNDE
jgi:hypothetical protein